MNELTPVIDTITDRSPMARALNLAAVYLSNPNISVNPDQIPDVVANCLKAITNAAEPVELKVDLTPAVPIKKSVTPDFIICLEDGKKFKSLKRHLNTHYKMTPEQYREKWGLPADYPMVAPNYSATRSQLAKATGLGTKK